MKILVFILVASLAGLVYQYRQQAGVAREELEKADAHLQQLQQKADAPNPLQQQLATLQQQLGATAQQLAAARQQLAVQRFPAPSAAPSNRAFQGTALSLPTPTPSSADTGLHGTALDAPAQPTSAHVNVSRRGQH